MANQEVLNKLTKEICDLVSSGDLVKAQERIDGSSGIGLDYYALIEGLTPESMQRLNAYQDEREKNARQQRAANKAKARRHGRNDRRG